MYVVHGLSSSLRIILERRLNLANDMLTHQKKITTPWNSQIFELPFTVFSYFIVISYMLLEFIILLGKDSTSVRGNLSFHFQRRRRNTRILVSRNFSPLRQCNEKFFFTTWAFSQCYCYSFLVSIVALHFAYRDFRRNNDQNSNNFTIYQNISMDRSLQYQQITYSN